MELLGGPPGTMVGGAPRRRRRGNGLFEGGGPLLGMIALAAMVKVPAIAALFSGSEDMAALG